MLKSFESGFTTRSVQAKIHKKKFEGKSAVFEYKQMSTKLKAF